MSDKSIKYGLIFIGIVLSIGVIYLIFKKQQPSSEFVVRQVTLKPVDNTVILKSIDKNIEKQLPWGEVTDEHLNITDTIYMLYDERERGLHWSSFSLTNEGPNPVYICVNKWKQPLAPLPVGRSISVDLKQRDSINKIYLKCDTGNNASVNIHAIK